MLENKEERGVIEMKDVPKEVLDKWWLENRKALTDNPNSWDAQSVAVLLENEYNRRGWRVPEEK